MASTPNSLFKPIYKQRVQLTCMDIERESIVGGNVAPMYYRIELRPNLRRFNAARIVEPVETDWTRVLVQARIDGEILCRITYRDKRDGPLPRREQAAYFGMRARIDDNRLYVDFEFTEDIDLLSLGFCVEGISRWLTSYFDWPIFVPSLQSLKLLFYSPASNLSSGRPAILRRLK